MTRKNSSTPREPEVFRPQIRRWNTPGFGPTTYLGDEGGSPIDEVDILESAAGELSAHMEGQWSGTADPYRMEMIASALYGVIRMWKARVPMADGNADTHDAADKGVPRG